jgi:DNA modification methylase
MLKKIKDGLRTIAQARAEVDKLFEQPGNLHTQYFEALPFSVLDAGDEGWRARKTLWEWRGVRPKRERSPDPLFYGLPPSAFDPVLCECVYHWFAPPGGHILDPFAGEPTMGIVAAWEGHPYTGVELRAGQAKRNNTQLRRSLIRGKTYAQACTGPTPKWICGDSANLDQHLPAGEQYDLIFTSPPYFNLEVYSKNKKDGSTFKSYEKFMVWFEDVFRQAAARLRKNRFLVVKLGEIRDEKGFFRNFIGDSIACFERVGMHYYNAAILVAAPASAQRRVHGQFPNYRKLVGTHQHILCFLKGDDWRVIPKAMGVLETSGRTDWQN